MISLRQLEEFKEVTPDRFSSYLESTGWVKIAELEKIQPDIPVYQKPGFHYEKTRIAIQITVPSTKYSDWEEVVERGIEKLMMIEGRGVQQILRDIGA